MKVKHIDAAGNGSITNVKVLKIDTSKPLEPTLSLFKDTGFSDSDRFTNHSRLNVSNLEPGATWEYSTDTGSTWTKGSKSFFSVAPGAYVTGAVQVRQTDGAGNSSDPITNFPGFKIDVTDPAAPTLALASDSGISSTDRITNKPTLLISNLEDDATWEYSLNSGRNWSKGSGSSFEVSSGSYSSGKVRVRQIDPAGNISAFSTTNSFSIDTIAPSVSNIFVGGSDNLLSAELTDQTVRGVTTAGNTVYVLYNGTSLGPVKANSNGQFSYSLTSDNIQAIGQGSGKSLEFADLAGNVAANTSLTFNVDTRSATNMRDRLIGSQNESDYFTWTSLTHSLLSAYDTITNYDLKDALQLAHQVNTASIASSSGNINTLTAANISGLLTTSTFTAASTAAFTVSGISGTFVAANNSIAGFQGSTDAIIFLKDYTLDGSNIIKFV